MAQVSLILLLFFGGCLALSEASLDFCVPSSDTEKLFGQKSELCYIKNGVLNRYAMDTFNWVIPSHISTLNFYWRYWGKLYVASYELNVVYNPNPALGKWSSSLQSHKGEISRQLQNFNITLPCTGKAHGEIDLTIYLTIRAGELKDHYDLQLRRKKICLNGSQDETFLAPKDGFLGSLYSITDNTTKRDVSQTVSTKFYAIVGTVTVAFFIVVVAVALIVQKSKKKPSDLELDMDGHSHFGQPTSTTGQMPSLLLPEEDMMEANGYYATSSVKDSLLRQPGLYYETSGRGSVLHPPSAVYPSVVDVGRSMSHLNSHQLPMGYQTEELTNIIEDFKKKNYIEPSSVQISETVMEGTFGIIYKGVVTQQLERGEPVMFEVWIKTLKEGTVMDIQTRAMLEEAVLFQQPVAETDHKSINAVRAVTSFHADVPMLIYIAPGFENLKLFLNLPHAKVHASLAKLVLISIEILEGLDFLHSQQPPVIHRDIGARNCLVSIGMQDEEKPRAQITDSALARDLFPSDYECLGDNQNRPVKWLAKESLVDYVFTPASDIWSFGVLMWEMLSFGQIPYYEIDASEIESILADGYRLPKPTNCPTHLYEQMTHCWYLRPAERPHTELLLAILSDFYKTLVGGNVL